MQLQIGVIRGGAGSGYEESLCSGASVLSALGEAPETHEWQVHDIFIDREGVWHRRGAPQRPERALRMLDVGINALHGEGGEDGTIARTLECFSLPHTGTEASSAAALADRGRARRLAEQTGIRVPRSYSIRTGADAEMADALEAAIFHSVSPPVFVRAKDSTLVTPVFAGDAAALEVAIRQVLLFSPATAALVEEYIPGPRLAVGVVERFRGELLYVLPLAEMEPTGTLNCPARVRRAMKGEIVEAARGLFGAFGLRHYALFEFVARDHEVYFLDVRGLPALHERSPFASALEAVGVTLGEFAGHLVSLALARRRA